MSSTSFEALEIFPWSTAVTNSALFLKFGKQFNTNVCTQQVGGSIGRVTSSKLKRIKKQNE